MSEQLSRLQPVQRVIERSLENFKKIGRNNLTPATIRSRMSCLKETWISFMNKHAELERATPEATRSSVTYFKDNHFDKTNDAYEKALDYMAECLEALEPAVSLNQSFANVSVRPDTNGFSLSHLPPIRLPPFDGNYDEWDQFRDRFTALIRENKDLDNFARMHYLTSCLKGRALESIANIAITAANFPVAWKTLTSRYENKRRSLHVHFSTILNLTPLIRESASELHALHDKVNVAVASLENLQRSPTELWDDILVHIVAQKLDPITRKAWNLKEGDNDTPPSYAEFKRFLKSRTRALENCAPPPSVKASAKNAAAPRVSAATASTSSAAKCPLCQAQHYINACPKFVGGNPSQRRDLVKLHKRCFNCLSEKHSAQACNSKFSCRVCHKKHHSMLHIDSNSSADPSGSVSTTGSSPPASDINPEVHSLSASTTRTRSSVLLATAWVTVRVPSGRSAVIRALLDQGSEMTFISENLAQLLRARRCRMPISVTAVGGIHAGTFRHATQISISHRQSLTPSFSTTALILGSLTSYTPKRNTAPSTLSHLETLSWADPDPTSPDPIEAIIGADLYSSLILDGIRKGGVGQPMAQNSVLGWVISGPIKADTESRSSSTPHSVTSSLANISSYHISCSPSLEQELRRFWEVEELPQRQILTPHDKQCEEHFSSTHSRDSDGRYVVRLPFKKGPPIEIGNSRVRAEKMLSTLTRRLRADKPLSTEYHLFLAEYERLNHMRPAVFSQRDEEQSVYIPHHGVIREGSATSHIRVVFNASSVTSNGTSLNDHLIAGPKLQNEITAVILRWRQYQYVYSADIAKMYRQIRLDHRDINYQRILWQPSTRELPTDYQLLTVTYGMSCAPFLALRVLKQLVQDEGHLFPLAVPVLRDNIYVDDVLFSANDEHLIKQIRDEWASNSSSLLSDIDGADFGLACNKQLAQDEQLKILGIGWNPATDVFEFRVSLTELVPTSKRAILSTIAKLYDPLGWVTPVTITAKILMQTLWRLNLDWDDTISANLLDKWKEIYQRIRLLSQLQIPRWSGLGPDIRHAELHGFADASNVAYAAVVYLKVVSPSGSVTITLLAGKAKVAPLKPLSVPRLELSAALLLARLMDFVRETIEVKSLPYYCWTDSTIVRAWVTQHPSRWKTFIANRVLEIQSRLPHGEWRHVPTDENPADCASRGLFGDEILVHDLWWRGPLWLRLGIDDWPRQETSLPQDAPLEERIVALQCSPPLPEWDLASRYSAWPKLIRVTAYVLKFASLCRQSHPCRTPRSSLSSSSPYDDRPSQSTAITASDCNAAKFLWLKRIQAELFPKEINSLANKRPLSSRSSLLSLSPFLDNDGVLRVGGRLSQAPLPFSTRHPVLLSHHPLVTLIVHQAHLRALHAGPQLTLNILRREFWIIRARTLIKSVIHNCVTCIRDRAAIPTQIMGNLPAARVTATARSFAHCGIDYAGPVRIRASAGRGITSRKSYIALFICLATKAIHLELVGDCSTQAFLNAYSRFCARRGLPQTMYSDNGTTFVGADRELTSAYRAAVRDPNFLNATASDSVEWKFILPSAPHFGGLWEAGVRSVKNHLRRVLGNHTLTFEEFSTLLCRIEACLNSRPIAPLSDTLDDYECLTPGHFLIGSALTVNPEPSLLKLNENRLSRWQLVRHVTERFWKLWSQDYVNTLQQRAKWRKVEPQIHSGQLVLLRNSSLPPCKWELGRVTRCHPGSDGFVRVVTVKTATSEYQRPLVKLCVLPISSDETST
ncbi:PREDICTED: uncharacterized protein LOC105571249 [Vollenhovia emeryi]|uniref:uncharacterized protein LOC105571249 n=1 Tax=Vollenhovia emeryi TaxID=411798 RepID=UPI0005F4E22C|nr:PREDICTED: uncharacterized protein LOC105571249 [Vollenhovia emeryi]